MADKKTKPRGLGRGLSALMADVPASDDISGKTTSKPETTLPIESLVANPDQPRRLFTKEAMEDLANSIREKGVLQPLIVRPVQGGKYEIVAGERRWRAAQQAQLHELPVVVRNFTDTEVLEVAIIENIQRSDLNAVEEAAGYRQLMDRFGHTQEKLSEVLGKSRSYIANLLRLLSLPDEVQNLLKEGALSAGHARALITTEDPTALAKKVVAGGLSVRATEALVKKQQSEHTSKTPRAHTKPAQEKDADTRALEGDLAANLKMRVSIYHEPGGERGTLTLQYENLEQLDDLCRRLGSD